MSSFTNPILAGRGRPKNSRLGRSGDLSSGGLGFSALPFWPSTVLVSTLPELLVVEAALGKAAAASAKPMPRLVVFPGLKEGEAVVYRRDGDIPEWVAQAIREGVSGVVPGAAR